MERPRKASYFLLNDELLVFVTAYYFKCNSWQLGWTSIKKSSIKKVILCAINYLNLLLGNIDINTLEQDDNGNINNNYISTTANKVKTMYKVKALWILVVYNITECISIMLRSFCARVQYYIILQPTLGFLIPIQLNGLFLFIPNTKLNHLFTIQYSSDVNS